MRFEVRYFSKGGNTKKLADAIAGELGISAAPTTSPLEEKAEILFLGSSVYAGSPNQEVTDFIKKNAPYIGKIVCFGSSASGKSTYEKIKKSAEDNHVDVAPEFSHCPGKFLWMHKGRPNQQDFDDIVRFARQVIKE